MFSCIFSSLLALSPPATWALNENSLHPQSSLSCLSCLVHGQSAGICYFPNTEAAQGKFSSTLRTCESIFPIDWLAAVAAGSLLSKSWIHFLTFSSGRFTSDRDCKKNQLEVLSYGSNLSHSGSSRGIPCHTRCSSRGAGNASHSGHSFNTAVLCSAGCHCKGLNSSESPKPPRGHLLPVRATGLPGVC